MSTYWGLYCRTCDEECDLEWNHLDNEAQHLVSFLPLIATLRPLEEALSAQGHRDFSFPCDILHFAEQHHTHDVVARDEYGAYYGNCRKHYVCPCCGTRHHCRKTDAHEGKCGPAETDA